MVSKFSKFSYKIMFIKTLCIFFSETVQNFSEIVILP